MSTPTTAPLSEHRFPCAACGADLRFDPGADRLVCDHCGAQQAIGVARAQSIREVDLAAGLRDNHAEDTIEEVRVSICPNCAAQVSLEGAVHAAECPYCATPVVADTGVHRHIKPAALVPFALSQAQAKDAMTAWLGRLWFAPSGLQRYARKGQRMTGVYVPYWTFDAKTETDYTGERGTVYFETLRVKINGKTQSQKVPRVRWRPARGRVRRFFDDVLVLAAHSLPKANTDALEPWDLSALVPYAPAYLAGFRAEGYQVDLRAGLEQARHKMDRVIARDIRMDIGGDQQRIHSAQTAVSDVTFKHILLPIWIAAYKYRGQSYRFVVNAQTGRVQGQRPYSAIKIALAVLLGLLVATGLGYVLATAKGEAP